MGGGSKQLDESASQSLILNIVSVFIEFLKKQMQAKRMNSSRWVCAMSQQISQSSVPRTAPSDHANISFSASWQ